MQNQNNNFRDTNECTSRASCSLSPAIASLESLAINFSQKIAYYMLQLKNFGAENVQIRNEILNIWAGFISVNEFSSEQLYEIVLNEYYMLCEAEKIYSKLSGNNVRIYKFNFSSKTTLAKSIAIGDKLNSDNIRQYPLKFRNLSEILFLVLKSLCFNMIQLAKFGKFDEEIFNEILITLNLYNSDNLSEDVISSKILKLAECTRILLLRICENLFGQFGEISEVSVAKSSKIGKAIMVSGNDFFDLLEVLKITEGMDIDVYTHSNLLIAHAFSNFKNYKNLTGHFGDFADNTVLDYARFPGAILLTANSFANSEYLYRGRLFSTDYIVPRGVERISNNDYGQLLNSALEEKGFTKVKQKSDVIVGYDLDEIKNKFYDIASNLKSGKCERLYIIFSDAHSEIKKLYFDSLFQNLKNDEFVISFSYKSESPNVYTINVGDYFPLMIYVLNIFFDIYPHSAPNIIFLYPKCDVVSITDSVMLKNFGAKNIFVADCSPVFLNPSVFNEYIKTYNINVFSNINEDLEIFRKIKAD